MSLRFLFTCSVVLLLISAIVGWLAYGERELGPEELRILAHKNVLQQAEVAAKSGSAEEWTAYGFALMRAPDFLRDYAEARVWLDKAASEGYVPAQIGMGLLFENGWGVTQNYHRAVEWYETATRLSRNPQAQFKMGEAYFRGRGRPQDYGSALPFYLRAADAGHPVAQFIIGSMYEAGWGVDRDLIEAWVWYHKALRGVDQVLAHSPDYDVNAAIRGVEAMMNNSQIATAKRRLERATN